MYNQDEDMFDDDASEARFEEIVEKINADVGLTRFLALALNGNDRLLCNEEYGFYNDVKAMFDENGDKDIISAMCASLLEGDCIETTLALMLEYREIAAHLQKDLEEAYKIIDGFITD